MELDHEFTVPVPVDQAWSVLLDVERVALCMPGATLDSVDGDEYAGRLKVKVGAMTVTYRGTARIAAADASSRTVTIEAAAKEARGSGTASATVQARLHDEGDTTRVTVHTKLNVTGRPAQFGRNILAEVGAKLVTRFAKALAKELESPTEAAEQAAGGAVDQQAAAEAAQDKVAPDKIEDTAAPPPSIFDTRPDIPVVEPEPASTPEPEPASAQEAMPTVPAQRPASPAESTVRPLPVRPRQEEDAIDLLAVAGPSIVRRAIPAVAAAVAVLLAVRYLFRRRRG
ncbi:SRPBCC family protein [Actinomadura rudentiformis]|uniref:Carbon monoxide dehydrogenase n=1 Tax=Actinomadura rudentiformis TaxID=359158 RepID=A0A6H9Z956_9ACTN|nr:SRPBCC family protein [Actinomadura rudentiformis]KAB2351736.1 carbon monoxide dehydrogenase [Actinomadura rudentiformis]